MANAARNFNDFDQIPQSSGAGSKIYVIDDDSHVRKALFFRFSDSAITVWPYASAADFLDQLAFLSPAPILLDIRMDNIDGLQLLEILKERSVVWPVIILTAHGDVGVAVRAMKLGAIEFLEKPFAPEALDEAVAEAFGILDQTQNMLSERDQARYRIGLLSARESETLTILMKGVANKEVAHRLGLSVRTIEMHGANALNKLGVKSIAEVVQLVNTGGLTRDMKLRFANDGDV